MSGIKTRANGGTLLPYGVESAYWMLTTILLGPERQLQSVRYCMRPRYGQLLWYCSWAYKDADRLWNDEPCPHCRYVTEL